MTNRDLNWRINIDKGRSSGADDVRRIRNEADALEKDLRQATRAADRLDDSLSKAGRGASLGGSLGAVERFSRGLGVGGGADVAGLIGDIMDVRDALPDLSKGFGGLLTSVGPAALAIGGVTIAMDLLNRRAEEAAKSAQDYVEYVSSAAAAEVEYSQALRDGGTARLEAAQQAQADELDILSARAEAQREIMRQAEEAGITRLEVLGHEYTQFRNANAIAYDAAKAELQSINDLVKQLAPAVLTLDSTLESADVAAVRASEGFGVLSDALEKGRGAVDGIADLVTGALESIGDMAAETAEAAAEAAEKTRDAVQSAVDKLNADADTLGDTLRNRITSLNQAAAEATADAAEEIAALQTDAARDRLEAESDYYKETKRAFEDFRAEQRRISQDADRAALDAIESNRIDDLLGIREQEQVDKQRNRDRFETERQRRQQDFADRQQADAESLALTIANIHRRRDEDIAAIQTQIAAERSAFEAAIVAINAQKEAQLAQIAAVSAANDRKHGAELAAVETVRQGWEAIALYRNGQLYQINPALRNSPATAGSMLAVPPPPVDPFGIGNFFNAPPPAGPEGALSVPPVSINMPPGAVIVGDLASKQDVFQSVYDAIRAAAAALYQARTGVSA
jgi:hypothetical protein